MQKFRNYVCAAAIIVVAGSNGSQAQQDAREAIAEGLPEHLLFMYDLETSGPEQVSQQVYAGRRRWNAGDNLKICFFGGDQVVRSLIVNVASEWTKHANIRFDFGSPGVWRDCMSSSSGFSQIRIGFSERGYWSAVGTDSITQLNSYQPSMNFERFATIYSRFSRAQNGNLYTAGNVVGLSREDDRGTILHEFGHALAILHEAQNPTLNCRAEIIWEGQNNIYDYYAGPPNYWSREKTDRNVGWIYAFDPDAQPGEPDRESIMMYGLPSQVLRGGTQNRCYVQNHNNSLSRKDIQLVERLYPRGAAPASDTAFAVAGAVPAAVAAAPSASVSGETAASRAVGEDRLARIMNDIISRETSVRREARRQLAIEIQTRNSADFIKQLLEKQLLEKEPGELYRYQLGVMVALSKVSPNIRISDVDRRGLEELARRINAANPDPTLSRYIQDFLSGRSG